MTTSEKTLEDSGKRKEFETGAKKDPGSAELYGRYDLIPPSALRRLALIYSKGAKKYSDRNWEKGIPTTTCIDSLLRHINRWREGSRVEDHLAQAAFWLFAIMFFEGKKKPGITWRPNPGSRCFLCKKLLTAKDVIETYEDEKGGDWYVHLSCIRDDNESSS